LVIKRKDYTVSILSHDKIVIGLFDSDIDAEKTVDKLYQVGFGREAEDETIEVYDRYRFAADANNHLLDQHVIAQPSPGTGGPPGMIVAAEPSTESESDYSPVRQAVADELEGEGMDREQADYFGDKVACGAVVVVVKAGEQRVADALKMMEKHSSKISTLSG
jgi:hypothetical protein